MFQLYGFAVSFVLGQTIYSLNKATGVNSLEQEGGKSKCIDAISVHFSSLTSEGMLRLKSF